MHVSPFGDVTLGRYILFQLHVRFVNAITYCLYVCLSVCHSPRLNYLPISTTTDFIVLGITCCFLFLVQNRTRVIVVQSDHAASWLKRRHFCLLFGRPPFRVSTGTPTFSTSCVVSLSPSRWIPVMSCNRPRRLPPYLQWIILPVIQADTEQLTA